MLAFSTMIMWFLKSVIVRENMPLMMHFYTTNLRIISHNPFLMQNT